MAELTSTRLLQNFQDYPAEKEQPVAESTPLLVLSVTHKFVLHPKQLGVI